MSLLSGIKKDCKKYLSFKEHLEKGRELLRNGEFSKAGDHLRGASGLKLKTDTDSDYNFLAGITCLALKKTSEAVFHLEKCSDMEKRPEPVYFLGLANYFLGMREKASEMFNKSSKFENVHPDVYFWSGLAYIERGMPDEAEKEFAKCANSDPDDVFYLHELAGTLYEKGRYDAVIDSFDPGKPVFEPLRLLAARAAVKAGKTEIAREMLASNEPKPQKSFYLEGLLEYRKGRTDKAQELFQKSLSETPFFRDDIKIRLKIRYNKKIESGVPAECVRCEESLVLEDFADRYCRPLVCTPREVAERLGDVRAAGGFFNDAVRSYESGLKSKTSDGLCIKLSLIYLLRKQYAEAVQAIRRATGADSSAWHGLIERYCMVEQDGPIDESLFGGPADILDDASFRVLHCLALGKFYHRTGDRKAAVENFIQAKRIAEERIPSFSFPRFLAGEAKNGLKRAYALESENDGTKHADSDEKLYSLLSRTYELFRRNQRHERAAEAADIREEYDRPLTVAVAGEFNAGKSTFINAIVGREIVPCGINPTTATINILKYGPEPKLRIHLQNGGTRTAGTDKLEEYVRHRPGDAAVEIDLVEIFLPEQILRSINIVDTPGFNSEHEQHDRATAEYLKKSDAVVWLFSADRAGTLSEFDALEPLRKFVRKTVAVINKIDILRKKEDADRLVKSVESKTAKYVSAVRTVSARAALAAKLENNRALLDKSGYPELESWLGAELFSKQKDIKRASTLNKLKRLFGQASRFVDREVRQLETALSDFRELSENVSSGRQKMERFVIPRYKVKIPSMFNSAYETAAEKLFNSIIPSKKLFENASILGEDRTFVKETLVNGVLDGLAGEIGEPCLEEASRAGAAIVAEMDDFSSRAGFREGPKTLRADLVREKEELFADLVLTPGFMYLRGYIESGVMDAVIDGACGEYKNLDAEKTRELVALRLADMEACTGKCLDEGLKKWTDSYFRTIEGMLSLLRQRMERREHDVKDGLCGPFRELAGEVESLEVEF